MTNRPSCDGQFFRESSQTLIEIEDRGLEEETIDVRLLQAFPVAEEVVPDRTQDLVTGLEPVCVAERLEGGLRYLEQVEVDEVTSHLTKVEPTDERARAFRLADASAIDLLPNLHLEHERTCDGMYASLERDVVLDGRQEVLRVLDELHVEEA